MGSIRAKSAKGGFKPLLLTASIAIAVHAGLIASVKFDGNISHVASASAAVSKTSRAPKLAFSCTTDAGLAFAAGNLRCLLEEGESRTSCLGKIRQTSQTSFLLCEGLQQTEEDVEEIALLEKKEQKAIQAIPVKELEKIPPKKRLVIAQLLPAKPKAAAPKAPELQRELPPARRSQVVEITAPESETAPDKARLLSEFNTSVEKQTVARGSTEKMVSRPDNKDLPIDEKAPKPPNDAKPVGEESQNEDPAKDSRNRDGEKAGNSQKAGKELLAMRQERSAISEKIRGERSGAEEFSENGLAAKKGDSSFDRREQKAIEGQEEAGGGGTRQRMPNLMPGKDIISRVAGGGSVDKLDDVESGDTTALNSRKWKYASFFNRMKRQVAQNWDPNEAVRRAQLSRNKLGGKDRVTLLNITLAADGKLKDAVVLKSSGIRVLDDEAIRAFRIASPFPNPPGGLVSSSSGQIEFSFGFSFGPGRRSDWKIFRNR